MPAVDPSWFEEWSCYEDATRMTQFGYTEPTTASTDCCGDKNWVRGVVPELKSECRKVLCWSVVYLYGCCNNISDQWLSLTNFDGMKHFGPWGTAFWSLTNVVCALKLACKCAHVDVVVIQWRANARCKWIFFTKNTLFNGSPWKCLSHSKIKTSTFRIFCWSHIGWAHFRP